MDEQAVGIVQLVAEVVVDAVVVLAAQEHRRQRRHVERRDGFAGEQRRGDVDARLHRRHDFELERAGDRLAVEQGVNDDAVGGRVGRLDPELAEEREFLVGARAGADAEAARRKAVALAAAEEAEVARAEEGDDLVHHVRRVERVVEAEAGEAEGDGKIGRRLVAAPVEHPGGVGDRRRDAVAQHVDHHRPAIKVAEVEQLEAEARARLAEQRLVGLEADVAPGVVVEAGDAFRQRRDRRVERRGGEIARALDHVGHAEGRRLLREGRSEHPHAGHGDDAGQQRSAIQRRHETLAFRRDAMT